MRFSIITITYNADRYLKETLESAERQSGVCFEHILWDGGSHDQTLSIARSFPHLKIVEGKDGGIADAMNRAASHAQGEYLLFLHADDFLAHNSVLHSVDRILSLHSHVTWLYGRASVVDEEGNFLRITPYEPFSAKRLRKYNFITHPATFVKKSLFEQIGGFRTDLRYCMDYELWLRLARVAIPFVLATPLASFREHQGSLSTSQPLNVAKEAHLVRLQFATNPLEKWRSFRTFRKRKRTICDLSAFYL